MSLLSDVENSHLEIIMSSNYEKKLRMIRKAEGMTQKAFAELLGLSLGSVRNYETGHVGIGLKTLEVVIRHPQFSKYMMWLMTDQVAPAAGQISPPLSPDGRGSTSDRQKGRKAG